MLLISITFDGVDFHQVDFAFYYTFEPQVYEYNPVAGPRLGGNLVYVKGCNFDHDSVCDFGGIITEAIISSDTGLSCIAPSMMEGSVFFSVVSKSTWKQRRKNENDSNNIYTSIDDLVMLTLNP